MRTILFVDDEHQIHNTMKRLYHGRSDVRCLFASSGAEGLDILEREEVWVIVSDNMMPGMNGIEFLARARAMRPQALRIMMTAHADLSIAIDAINRSEAFRFVTKPFRNSEMTLLIDEALMRYQLMKSILTDDETIYLSLAQTVELKDPYTKGHCDRVAGYAMNLARVCGLEEEGVISEIKHGSWLHDCGKIGVPEAVLNYPGRLSEEEMKLVMLHPVWGADVARQAHLTERVINIILYHHERFDGKGYPFGLKGEIIPVEARIVMLADVFDGLTSERPYRKAFGCRKALEIMKEMTATHFDPRLAEIFLPMAGELLENLPGAAKSSRKPGNGTPLVKDWRESYAFEGRVAGHPLQMQ